MIVIGPVTIAGMQWVVQGQDPRAWVRVEPSGITICTVEEHGLVTEGRERREFLPAAELGAGFRIRLPFRRSVWARTLSVLSALAPAGWYYDGNVVRVDFGDSLDCVVEMGRREEWIVTKAQARAVDEWTATMSSWSMVWVCHEEAFGAFWSAVGDRNLSRRRLRRALSVIQTSYNPRVEPPADLARKMNRALRSA